MSTPSAKSNVLEDDDDDQDYIPVGVLQVSSFRQQPAILEQIQARKPQNDDLDAQASLHDLKHQQNQSLLIPQTNLNYPQFGQLGLEEFEQGQSSFRKNDVVEEDCAPTYQHAVLKNPHFQTPEKEDVLKRSKREHEEKQDHLPQYKLLLQLMQQQQRAQAPGINSDQGNQNPVKVQARIRTASLVQNNSASENQTQLQKLSREDLNSNVPLESQNQLLKILTLAQRDQQAGQKYVQNSAADSRINSNDEGPSNISQGSVKHNIPRHIERDSPVASKSALRIEISPNYQHIPRSSTEYLPQQSPTSSTAGFHPYHPNVNNQHPEITKRLNSPVSPGRQSTSPRQTVSPRHAGGSPRQVSSSPCQFISPKQPVSPRGTTIVSSRKSQPSSPQSFHHSPSSKAQSGFSWQPSSPSSSSQIVPARRISATSSSQQDLPNSVSQFQNPLNSLNTLTYEATVENIHQHPSKFQPITTSAARRRTLSGGIVHHRATTEPSSQCQFSFSPSLTPNGPFPRDSALSLSQHSAISRNKPLTPQMTVSSSVSNAEQIRSLIKDTLSVSMANDQCSSATLTTVPSSQDSVIQDRNSSDVADSTTHFNANQKMLSKLDLPVSNGPNNLVSSAVEETVPVEITKASCEESGKNKTEISECEGVFKNFEAASHEKDVGLQLVGQTERSSFKKVNESNECTDVIPKVKKVDKKQTTSKDKDTVVKNSSVSLNRELEKLDNSDNANIRETSSKRLRKPKVPFEDSSLTADKVKKNERTNDKHSRGKHWSKNEKHRKEQKVIKSSSTLKQSVLTRSSLRRKGSKLQLMKRSDSLESRGQLMKRTLRGSDLKMKSNRYLISRKMNNIGKEAIQKQKVENSGRRETENVVKNGNKNLRDAKQELKKGNELSVSQVKGKNGKDNKDHREPKKGSESTLDQKKDSNGKDGRNEQKRKSESDKEQRRGSDAAGKRPDKDQRLNSSKDSSSTVDNEVNTRSSTRLTKQLGNPEDRSKNRNSSNSRSRNRTHEPPEDPKSQNERVTTRGSRVQESSISNERVATRASKSNEPVKDSKSTSKTVIKDSKTEELSVEQNNSTPNSRVSTRGSKAQEGPSPESNLTTKEKVATKSLRSLDVLQESNSTSDERIATRGSKAMEVSAISDSTPIERISTRSSKTPTSTTSEKTVTRGMTTRRSDGTKSASKRPIDSSDSSLPSRLSRKRTRSEEVHPSMGKEVSHNSESRPQRSKPGSQKVKHDFKNSDEDEEYNAEEEDEGSSDDRISPTTTRSGRVTSAPKRKISMCLRREASKRKYNIDEQSISDESSDSDDDSESESEKDSDSETDVEMQKDGRERKYPSRKGDKRIDALLDPKYTSDVKKDTSSYPTDVSKMMGFKLVPLTPEEMSKMPGKDSMLPFDGFMLPGTNCILFPAHFTQHVKVENQVMSTCSTLSSTQSISQPTRVLATPRPISSITESSSVKTSSPRDPLPPSTFSSLGSHHHTGLRNQSVVPSAPTPPPAVSLSSSSSSTRLSSSVASTNPWNSPSLPTPPPSVSSSSSHSSSSWNPVANLQPWMSDGSAPGSTAWNESSGSNNEGWRGNNSNNSQNNAYLPRGPYGNNSLPLNTEIVPMHDSTSQRLHDLSGSGQDPLYISDRVSASSPPVEGGLFRDSSNLSPSGYNNIALPGLGQQDISYLESKLQQEMDMSSMLLSEVPYEDEMQEPVSTMHHGGIPVCSVNLDDAEVSGRLGSVTPTLHLPSGSRGLENVNDMRPSQQQQQLQQQQQQPQQQPQHSQQQPQHQPQQQVQHHQQQQQQPQQRKQQTGFLEELMTEPRVETASTTPNVMGGNMEEASPIVVGNNTGEKTPVNTKRHLYEIIIKDEKKFGKCKICNGSFSLTSIYRHLKKHEDPTAGISCTLCGKKYSQRHNLVSHMKKIHNNGVDSRGDAREEERKKEVLEPIPKPEHSDSLESPPVEKFTVPQSATESESQIDSKEGSETKDGKKKPRKWSMDRKFTKDGLMYELMPDSPVPVSVKSKRKTQRQVERVRRFKAKKKYEAGKNIHGITYDLSKLEADTSSASEDDGESEKAQEGFEEKETSQKDSIKFNVGSNFDTNTNLEKNVGEGGKLKEENEDSKELENNGNVKVSEVVSAAFSDSKVSSSAPSGGKLNVPSSSTIKMDQQERTEARSSDISKDDDDTVEMKEPSAETNLSGTMTESESSVVDEEGISEEVSHANDSDNKAESEVTETTASNPTKEKYPCTLCTSVLASKCSFFLHMKRHRSVKDKVCNYCGKGFITGQELRSHERTHTGERPYTCDICKYTFAHQGSYQAHKKGHVKRGETEPFPPEKCYNGGGKGQQPQRRKKRAQSDGAGLQTKQKQDNSSVSVTEKSDGSPMSVQDNDNTGSESANSSKGDVSGGNMSGSDSTMRRRSLESSGLNQQHASGGMRSPGWPVANSGSGAPWEGRSSSSEQQPQQTMPHGVISNVPQQRTPAANFRDQSSPSFYSPSPTHYGPSPGAENQMMSPNVSSHPANQITSPGNYLPQQTPHNNHPHHLPSQQRFPAPHSPHMAHNMNAMKSPTHEPNYAAGNANQSYSGTGSSSGGNYDDGRLFASPGPPPPSATLVHPRKQQQQKQQMTHPPQNYSPSQQYNMFGSTPTASSSSPNSYSQPVQQQPQQQQHHHHQHHPQQQREQSGDIVNALLSQYNIPPASPYTGNARQMQSAPMQQQSQQQHQSQQHQQRHQIAPQFHNIHHQGMSQQKQQPQQYHQYHQSPSTQQQQHHHQQHPQQPSPVSGQRNMQQPFTPPPPYNPNQPKPPPPYPASYNEFYRSPQHIDESQQQSQPAQKQQAARIGSPSMHPHHHQGLNAPSSYAQFQTSPSPQQNATALSRPVSNQPATADINNTTINNNSFSQQGVRPAIQPSSPSINPQQQPPYHHHPSPSSTPSPGYFHQGTSPSSSG